MEEQKEKQEEPNIINPQNENLEMDSALLDEPQHQDKHLTQFVDAIEQSLKHDSTYISKRGELIFENAKEDEVERFFELAEYINQFVDLVLQKKFSDQNYLAKCAFLKSPEKVNESTKLVEFLDYSDKKEQFVEDLVKIHHIIKAIEHQEGLQHQQILNPMQALQQIFQENANEENKGPDEEALVEKEMVELYGQNIKSIIWGYADNVQVINQFGRPKKKAKHASLNVSFSNEDMCNVEEDDEFYVKKQVDQHSFEDNGQTFSKMDLSNQDQLEGLFQKVKRGEYLEETYLQLAEDVFFLQVDSGVPSPFLRAPFTFILVSIGQDRSFLLSRKEILKVEKMKTEVVEWGFLGDQEQPVYPFEAKVNTFINRNYNKCRVKKTAVSKPMKLLNVEYVFYMSDKNHGPCLINVEKMLKTELIRKETVQYWDPITVLKPPPHISIESGNIWQKIDCDSSSGDYKMIENLFFNTFLIQKKGAAGFRGVKMNALPTIQNIHLIHNCVLYEKFVGELKRLMRKYPQKKVNDIMKHLFHGTRETDPALIYKSEDGLDIRFSNSGVFGQGIYFADNSCYSHGYSYQRNGVYQMFVCLVLIGESVTENGNKQYRVPPLKPGSETERFDSINNGQGGHYIIYDNVKSYPGYIISYSLN